MICIECDKQIDDRPYASLKCPHCKEWPCNYCRDRYWNYKERLDYHSERRMDTGWNEPYCKECDARVTQNFWDDVFDNLRMVIFLIVVFYILKYLIN